MVVVVVVVLLVEGFEFPSPAEAQRYPMAEEIAHSCPPPSAVNRVGSGSWLVLR